MSLSESLDQRYLEFTDKMNSVFVQCPQIEPLRYFIFRDLLIQPQSLGFQEIAKRLIRPLLRYQRTSGLLQKGNILIWIEGARGIIRDTLLPVFLELTKRGERPQLVSFNGPDDLPNETLIFRCPAGYRAPIWARHAWDALCQAEPKIGQRALERSFLYACANLESFFQEMNRVLDTMRPQIVVTASTQLMGGYGLLVSARLSGIRTILLQHGIVQPFYIPIAADAMVTWGPSSSDSLVRFGIDSGKLLPLGSPRHDVMGNSNNGTAKQNLMRQLALEEKLTLVFFSNGNDLLRNGTAPVECARWLDVIAKNFRNDVQIIVRLHPNEDGSLFRDSRHLTVVKDRPDLEVLLDGCDCVASLCSTAMYEALLYGKPVWQFYADGWPELADNWRKGLAKRISSERELIDVVECMLEKGSPVGPNGSLAKDVFNNHGRATEAVADFIVSQLR